MLPRRSAPVVLGLVVTSLVTMLAGTQLVTEMTRPSFQRTRPIELTLGALGPVQAGPATPGVGSGRFTGAEGPAGRDDAHPPPAADLTTRRPPAPAGALDGPEGVATVADRNDVHPDAREVAGGVPEEAVRTLIGHRRHPCRGRAGRLPGRRSSPCRRSGTVPAQPAREPEREAPPARQPPRAPTPDPEPGEHGRPSGRRVRAAVPPTVSGPPRVRARPSPEAGAPCSTGGEPGTPADR